MTPSNHDNNQPLIYRIADAAGVFHLVAPVDHNHTMSEVAGLESALSTINTTLGTKANASDVNTALAGKMDNKTIDSTPTADSPNLVTSGGVAAALATKMDNKTIDSTPTADSPNLVTSGGVAAALATKMDNKTIDSTPTADSPNLVTSGGVKAALDEKADLLHTHNQSQILGLQKDVTLSESTDRINISSDIVAAGSPRHIVYYIKNATENAINLSDFISDGGTVEGGSDIAAGAVVVMSVYVAFARRKMIVEQVF